MRHRSRVWHGVLSSLVGSHRNVVWKFYSDGGVCTITTHYIQFLCISFIVFLCISFRVLIINNMVVVWGWTWNFSYVRITLIFVLLRVVLFESANLLIGAHIVVQDSWMLYRLMGNQNHTCIDNFWELSRTLQKAELADYCEPLAWT